MKPITRNEVERFAKLCCIASKADCSVTTIWKIQFAGFICLLNAAKGGNTDNPLETKDRSGYRLEAYATL
jgi:hypothetical protein